MGLLLPVSSIRARLAGFVLCAMLPLIGLMAITLVLIKAKNVEMVQHSALLSAKIVAENTDQFLADTASLLRALARRPAFRALDPQHCDPEISTFLSRHAGYMDIGIDTLDGSAICTAAPKPPSGRPLSVSGAKWFARAVAAQDQDDIIFGSPVVDPISQTWVSVATIPLRGMNGIIGGFVTLSLDLHHFQPLKHSDSLPNGSTVIIVNNEGTVMARSSDWEVWAGRNLARNELLSQTLAETEGVGRGCVGGSDRIYAFAPVPTTRWHVIVAIPPRAAFEATNGAFLLVGLGSVALLGLVAGLGILLARGIDRPLRKMAAFVERAAEGRTDLRLEEHGPTEIRQLALQFNAMLEARRQSEEAVKESESRFRNLANSVPVSMWLTDTNKRCVFVNQPWLDFTGKTFEQVVNDGWVDLLHPDDRPTCLDSFGRAFEARQPFAMEFRVRHHDGQYRWIYDQGVPRIDEAGTFLGYAGGGVDITDRKIAEERLIEARQTAETSYRAKSAFLAMMSHELRTPMTGVIGMADFLSETPLNKDQRLYLDTMRSSARTLLTVLNDILDYSKIDAERLTLDCTTFDVVQLATETVRLFWPKAKENACTITFDAGGVSILIVRGDPTRIKQVLGNLISNAVKFTNAGTITVSLSSAAVGDRLRLTFEVEDTGIGIAEADKGRLFLPFSQTDAGATRKFGGTGLGLAICKRLVELMDGDIGVASQPGRGSRFRFTCLVERGKTENLTGEPQQSITVPPMAILLAEDNPINRMIVKVGLEQRQHWVTVVENGVLAYEAASRQRFDVILMDLQMPVMDGSEATRLIRTLDPPLSEVPIIALTADALSEHRADYMEAGLTDFLTKPIEWSKVDAALARVAQRSSTASATGADGVSLDTDAGQLPLIDQNRLLSIKTLIAPPDFTELIHEFIRCAQDQLSALETRTGQGDLKAIQSIAHAIKGMFLNIGGIRVATLAHHLHVCPTIKAATDLAPALTRAINDTITELGT